MKTLMYLQEGILTDDRGIVSGYLEELDIKTANEEMIKAGERFGFKTIDLHGKIYGWMAEISRILGYADQHSYRRLLEKWEIERPNLGWYGSEYRTRIRETLGINEKDGRAALVDWTGFLVGGVKGEGKNADEVLAYLLRREREARIYLATVGEAKAEKMRQETEMHEVKMLKEEIAIFKLVGGIMPEKTKARYKTAMGCDMPPDAQQTLFGKN